VNDRPVPNGSRIVLIGAGDLGKEVYHWLLNDVSTAGTFEVCFLDGRSDVLRESGIAAAVIGSPDAYTPQAGDYVVCTVGNPSVRMRLCAEFEQKGAAFASLVHPSALVGPGVRIGRGCILFPHALVDFSADVGDHSVLYFRASIGHEAHVGRNCMLLTNSVVGSRCTLGDGVTVAINSFVRTGVTVGHSAMIGGLTFATSDVPEGRTVLGVPARIIQAPRTGL
jgi:sugar O-acyltransferase (sialic acid O-acetyltransferase NeuD family)